MVDGSVWFGLSDARAASDRDGRERRSAGMELTIVALPMVLSSTIAGVEMDRTRNEETRGDNGQWLKSLPRWVKIAKQAL